MIRNLLWLLVLSQFARADIFVLEIFNTTNGVAVNTTGTRPCGGGCILPGPEPGVGDTLSGTLRSRYDFGEPGTDNVGVFGYLLENNAPGGAETEIYLPETPDFPGNAAVFFDFPPPLTCATDGCIPAQNGTEYYLGDIVYTDGSTDSFYFVWFVSGLPIVAPEPNSHLLLGTAIFLACALTRGRCWYGARLNTGRN